MFYESSCFPQGNNKSIWSFLSLQAGHQLTCIFIHFTVNKGLKSKNWGNRHLWGIWGKSVELQSGVYRRGEGGIFFSHFTLPFFCIVMPFLTDLQGDNCNRCCDSKTELPLLLLDHVLDKTTLLPLLHCRSAMLRAGGYSSPNAYGCLKGKC